MSDDILDPGEPGDAATSLKAKDLVGHPCIFVPYATGRWDDKEAETDDAGNVVKAAEKGGPYVECHVVKLDRAGIVEESDGVRVSWYRVIPQLEDKIGRYIAAMPVQDQATGNGKSIILTPLSDAMKTVARDAVAALKAEKEYVPPPGEETF